MEQATINAIQKEKLIVIVRGIEKEKLIPLAEALWEGGVRLLEVTYSADGRVSDEETAARIGMLASHFEGRMLIGAGTVLSERQVELTHRAAGSFIISPDTYEGVIQRTKQFGMVSIPGALTPSEITRALRAGADFVKLFPITSLGTSYIKAIRAPLSHAKLLAVGGIDENNVADYLKAGAVGAGIGGNLVNLKWVAAGEYEKITEVARLLVPRSLPTA